MRTLNKGEWTALIIGAVIVIGVIFYMGMTWPKGNEQGSQVASGTATTTADQTLPASSTTSMKTVAEAGDTVSVTYTGKLADGTVFDSTSLHGGTPFTFVLGEGQVIKGWDDGVVGMKVGQTKTLVIPPADAYGAAGVQDPSTGKYVIPPNATLTFDVTLVSIQ